MLLKAVLLCALSPVVMAAVITSQNDIDVSPKSITYNDGDQGWVNIDSAKQGLDFFQEISIVHPDAISGGLYEQYNGSLYFLIKSNYLTRKSISLNGYQGSLDYPEASGDITSYGLMNGEPYILDTLNNTIWQWDANYEYWKDLNSSLNLPNGKYDTLYAIGDHYLLSMTDDVNNGLWKIGLTNENLTDVSLIQDSSLFFTPQGLVQVFKNNDGIYEGQWLDADLPEFFIQLMYDDYPNVRTAASYSGTFIHLYGSQHATGLWLGHDKTSPSYLALPQGTNKFNGCFSSLPRAFCIIETEELGFALYELDQGKFVLDTLLDSSIANVVIISIHAVGENRFMSVVNQNANSNTHSLLSVNSLGTEILLEADVASNDEWYSISTSGDPSVFYWVGREMGETKLYKAHVAGDTTFKRAANQDGAGNVDNNQEDDSDGGIGSLPLSITLLLFILLIPRSSRKTK